MYSREEIKRLKAENPNMTHKAAFSAAAKNVSNFQIKNVKITQYVDGKIYSTKGKYCK